MSLPEFTARGLFCIPDPHVAATPPGHRLPGYTDQVLDKLAACLTAAASLDLVPVILGDLFHWPRDNPNALLVALIGLFRPHRPFTLVGNHDKYQARLTADCSLSVLEAAGVVRLMAEPGPVFRLKTPEGPVLVGASPDAEPIPREFPREEGESVVWLTHHNVNFPDFEDKAVRMREIPGVDWVVNGHIHRPQATVRCGATAWANPGNITRVAFSQRSKERKPAAAIWRPGASDLTLWVVPHLPFEQVFPDQPFPVEDPEPARESEFLSGLERLAWRRTREGAGLKEFLSVNVNPESPEVALIWELYEEVVHAKER
jgi:DNA repair exonuclease SbcCD nuclease subunit